MNGNPLEIQPVLIRKDVPKNASWNWESVFFRQDWEAELKSIQAELPRLVAYQGHLQDGPGILADALATRQELVGRVAKVVMFAVISYQVDKTD